MAKNKKTSRIKVKKVAGSALSKPRQKVAQKVVTVARNAESGRGVISDRVGAAVKDAKARYGETLRRLK